MGIATCCAFMQNTHATDGGKDNMVFSCIVGGRSTVGSFSNYSEWDGSACMDGGHDKDDFLGDAGERYRSVSLVRLAKVYYYYMVSVYPLLHFYEFRPVVKRILIKGWHSTQSEAAYFHRSAFGNIYRSLFMKGFFITVYY